MHIFLSGGHWMNTGLKNKHVLITGASGGIGLELTSLFLSEGSRVTAAYHHSPAELKRIGREWPKQMIAVSADIRDEAQVKSLFEQANASFGRADVLIANAGIANLEEAPVHRMELKQWENTLAVNLTGTFLSAKYFFQNLESYHGDYASLVLVGSTAGVFGEAWFCDYATSKAAMHGLLMSLKNEIVHLAPKGRVNLVNPGWTITPMSQDTLKDPKKVRRILQTIPMRKTAVPADVANAILFLASDVMSGHVSGQAITVAGGMEGRVLFAPEEIRLPGA
jgi:NAD(P)-dependent dehydrogenase (short-subunit alcohol dehydrogenase family)